MTRPLEPIFPTGREISHALWRWLAVNLPRRMWSRAIVISAFVFGILGLIVGAALKVLGAPGPVSTYGAGVGAVAGILIAVAAILQGAWLRRRIRRATNVT